MAEIRTSTTDERGRGPWLVFLVLSIALGLPAYVLSVGPAVWLHAHGYLPDEMGYIYAPLAVVVNNCDPMMVFFKWYLSFWE